MDESIRNAVLLGGLSAAIAAVHWWRVRASLLGPVLLVAAAVVALVAGVLPVSSWRVWTAAAPHFGLLRLALWGLLGVCLWRSGGVDAPRWPWLGAFLGGAAYGGLPVALAGARGLEQSAAVRGRWVLVAMAGGLCGPLGNEVAWLVGGPAVAAALLPLGLLALLLIWPWGEIAGAVPPPGGGRGSAPPAQGRRVLFWLALPVWGLAMAGQGSLALSLALTAALLTMLRAPPDQLVPWPRLPLGWLVACYGAVWLLVPSGLLAFFAESLRPADLLVGRLVAPFFALGTLPVAVIASAPPVALALATAAHMADAPFSLPLTAGLTAGAGLGATLSALAWAGPGVLRAGVGRWGLLVLIAVAYLALVYTW